MTADIRWQKRSFYLLSRSMTVTLKEAMCFMRGHTFWAETWQKHNWIKGFLKNIFLDPKLQIVWDIKIVISISHQTLEFILTYCMLCTPLPYNPLWSSIKQFRGHNMGQSSNTSSTVSSPEIEKYNIQVVLTAWRI